MNKQTSLALAALASITGSSSAVNIAIANSDFEANGPGAVQATSWTPGTNTTRVVDHANNRNESASFGGGLHFAFTQGTSNPAEQTLTDTFAAGAYTFSANVNYGSADIGVDGIFDIGYDSVTGFVSVNGTSTIDLAPLNDGTPANGTGWARVSWDPATVAVGDAAIGETIIIRLDSSANQGFWFDNVELDLEPVPEPSSALLLSLAGLAGLSRRRR